MSQFIDISKDIVEDFLQTAVFLDDRAMFPAAEPLPTTVTDPVTGEVTQVVTPPETVNGDHDLNAKVIIDTFMQKGIVCSVVKCEEATFEEQRKNYLRLMKKTDIIVLDWDLFSDGGEKVVEIIKELVNLDEELHELRSIIIYTANDLETVKTRLESEELIFDGFVSHNKPYTTVSLWNKNSGTIESDRKADFSEVVDKCIDEFTETFHGIVPNVAMAGIAEIRKNTHKLLGVLNKNLDPAYLSHRALLPIPEESEKHLEEIIISEIESIIHQNQIGRKSNFKIIKKSPIIQDKTYQGIDFSSCVEEGVEKKIARNQEKQFKKDIKECFTKKWYLQDPQSVDSEKNFALLSLVQSNYLKKNIYLTLGVIVQEKKSQKMFICLQPRCDSTRLDNDTEFIFIELQDEKENKFDIVLPSDGKYIVTYKRKNRKTIVFTPEKGVVSPTGSLYFNSKDKLKYKYITTLKRTQAQRISNEYGAYLSRVGLNESEYLRRNRSKE